MRESELVKAQDVRDFFQEALTDLVGQRRMDVGDDTVAYVTNLLTVFARSDRFYEWTPQGPTLTPLAMIYAEIMQAKSMKHRQQMLQRLGDVALFMAGMFAESFNRKTYDVDYYIGMGGAAYGSLSACISGQLEGQLSSRVFAELSTFFSDFVQVLTDICEYADIQDDQEILRWYELWMRTGSKQAAKKLQSIGIDVANIPSPTRH
ncbi:MAG: hypothetical protein QNI91_07645 [Arenicellales bacterium]|nr:hypothetical protein [Arenicellales bacterium]